MKKTILAIICMVLLSLAISTAQEDLGFEPLDDQEVKSSKEEISKESNFKFNTGKIVAWILMIAGIGFLVFLLTKESVRGAFSSAFNALKKSRDIEKQWKSVKDMKKDFSSKKEKLLLNLNQSKKELKVENIITALNEIKEPVYFIEKDTEKAGGVYIKHMEEMQKNVNELIKLNKSLMRNAKKFVNFTEAEEEKLHTILKLDLDEEEGFENLKKFAKISEEKLGQLMVDIKEEKEMIMLIHQVNKAIVPKIEEYEKILEEEDAKLKEEEELIQYVIKEKKPEVKIIKSIKIINNPETGEGIAPSLYDKFLGRETKLIQSFQRIAEQKKIIEKRLNKEMKKRVKGGIAEKRLETASKMSTYEGALKIESSGKIIIITTIHKLREVALNSIRENVYGAAMDPGIFDIMMRRRPQLENYGQIAFFVKDQLEDIELANKINSISKKGKDGMVHLIRIMDSYFKI